MDDLCGEGNFRQQVKNLFALFQHPLYQPDVNLCLAAASHTVQQNGLETAPLPDNLIHGCLLGFRQNDALHRLFRFEGGQPAHLHLLLAEHPLLDQLLQRTLACLFRSHQAAFGHHRLAKAPRKAQKEQEGVRLPLQAAVFFQFFKQAGQCRLIIPIFFCQRQIGLTTRDVSLLNLLIANQNVIVQHVPHQHSHVGDGKLLSYIAECHALFFRKQVQQPYLQG